MEAPRVATRQRGAVTTSLESIAAAFLANNPGHACRWVFDPQTRPELSNVTGRSAVGYRKVYPQDLGPDAPDYLEEGKPVRISDLILMRVPETRKRELEQERADYAAEALKSIDRAYYDSIEAIDVRKEEHRPSAIGRTSIQFQDHTYEVEQRTGTKED